MGTIFALKKNEKIKEGEKKMAVNMETINFVFSDDEINFWAETLEEKPRGNNKMGNRKIRK